MVSAWVRAEAPDEVRTRIAAMQRRNYELRAAGPKAEWAPDVLDRDPALLGAIECPALLAAGAEDMVDFRSAVADLAARMPRTKTAAIPNCGHLAFLEAPEEFRRLVLENLR